MTIRTGKDLAAACIQAATDYQTLYVMGCFGAPMKEENKQRWLDAYSYNRGTDRAVKIQAASADTFGFDCVCLIKGLLWGWDGDKDKIYGGAVYASNAVPDIGEDAMIGACREVSSDFSEVQVGEMLYMPGHCGIYVGGGRVVECTPAWKDGVQVTELAVRNWTKHGKLPYISYEEPENKFQLPALKPGDRGEAVRAMQMLLILRGYSCGPSFIDGSYGPATVRAVEAFQQAGGIREDGCADRTWDRLIGEK